MVKENTLKDTYKVRDKQLKGVLYEDYLKSVRWRQIKNILKKDIVNRFCAKCKSKRKLNFHHLTYKNLNTEDDFMDIMVFCESCHEEIHDISKTKDLSVIKSTHLFLRLKTIKKKKKKAPKRGVSGKKFTQAVESEPKEKVIENSAIEKAKIAHELNNQRLLDNLNKYKKYFSSLKKSSKKRKK